ncbi:MAG TPA: hypothetical protein VG406_21975 [Isosphaeraceae bacterium]|jgi:hypothetical protein|nr:hypothetical protein [Isosphaeraceae bacterium]
MGNALGSSTQSQPTPAGPLWFDVSKFGAVPGDANNNLNKAWAAIYPLLQPGATVYVPDHPSGYLYTDPLVVPFNGVQFRGAGRHQSTIKPATGHAKTALVLGMPVKDNSGNPIDADHFVPLSGIMDSGYGPGRYGVRYRSPSTGRIVTAAYPRSPLAFGPGDSWGSAASSSLTIELAVEGYIGGVASCLPHGAVLGLGDYLTNAGPSPFFFVFTHGIYDNSLYSVNGAKAQAGSLNTITLSAATAGGLGSRIVGSQIVIVSGTGAGQVNQVTAFNSTTLVATVQNNWATVPDATSMYDVGNFTLEVHFRTGDGPLNGQAGPPFDPTFGGTGHTMYFPLGLYSGLLRLTVQLNLAGTSARTLGQCWTSTTGTALANFLQTADASLDGGTAGIIAGGLPAKVFQENQASHFQVNNLGITCDVCNNPGFPNAIGTPAVGDWMLAGLSFSLGQVYTVGTPASAQALNPAGPYPSATVNDTFRYHNTAGSANVVCLEFTDNATTDLYGGFLSHWFSGTGGGPSGMAGYRGCGFLLPQSQAIFLANQGVFDLGFQSGSYWGEAITFGRTFEVTIEDVYISGFYGGVGTLSTQSTYNHTIRSLAVQSTYGDAVFGYEVLLRGTDFTTYNPAPRCAFRLVGGSLYLRNCALFGQQAGGHYTIVCHQTGFAGAIDVEGGYFDSEGIAFPDIAFISVEQCEVASGHGGVRFQFFEVGSLGPAAPVVKLRGMGATSATKSEGAFVSDLSLQFPVRAVVQTDSAAGFVGEVERIVMEGFLYDGAPLIESLDPTGRSGVKARLDRAPASPLPPRTGLWPAGSVDVRCPDAVDGQFARFTPVGGGRYGTATPPAWAGEEVVRVSNPGPAGLTQAASAYVVPEDHITASPTQV